MAPEAGESDREHAGEQVRHYVQEQNEFSLVRYPPSERRINPIEKRLLEDRSRLNRLLGLADIFNPEVWRAALVEFVASVVVDFLSYTAVMVILSTWQSPNNPKVAIALIHLPIVALVILAAAPASGGHINPCITLATMITGHSSPVRAVLYIVAQSLGAVTAAEIAKTLAPDLARQFLLGGCSLNLSGGAAGVTGVSITVGLLSEFTFTFSLLLLAYFIALDPRQYLVTGPVLAPFLVGAIVALQLFLSGSLHPGYTGAGMHPARCLGPAVVLDATAVSENLWVFWVGPFMASFAMALVYHAVPPHHVDKYARRKDIFHQVVDLVRRKEVDESSYPSQSFSRVTPLKHRDTAHGVGQADNVLPKTHHDIPKPTHHDQVLRELRFE